jgi:SAM-dependent methyltransferase
VEILIVSSIKNRLKKFLNLSENLNRRDEWLKKTLGALPSGLRLLDAGAGEMRNKPFCTHLTYVSQDLCQYEGSGNAEGLQTGTWNTGGIDIVCDIVSVPEPAASFDVILCTEVFEHVPDAIKVLAEFSRLLKPGGKLITTAPFASFVHFAPYHYATGFSRYWYEYHLPANNFTLNELTPNGDWFSYLRQEAFRLPSMARRYGDWCWPLSYLVAGISFLYFSLRMKSKPADDLACFGWHCVATKR